MILKELLIIFQVVRIMDNRITIFIDKLKYQLKDLPEEEVLEAVNYYEEYLNDALDAGNDIDSIISKLEPTEKIATTIKTESYVSKAESHPGLGNFFKAVKAAFKSVSTPLSIFLLSILVLCTFCIVITFFAAAFSFAAGSLAVFLACIYEAVRIPFKFFLEKVGTLGIGLMTGAILMLSAIYLYKLGKFFIRLSSKQTRFILKVSGKPLQNYNNSDTTNINKSKKIIHMLLAGTVAGIILFGVSGLPWKFFIIFNSMKPEGSINQVVEEYDTTKINQIQVTTAHSAIRIKPGSSDKIIISYEEPNWLTHGIDNNGGILNFKEKSNGRLPFFSLISIHESATELLVSLPKGYNFDSVNIQSTGGKIIITDLTGNIEAKNLNGGISYTSSIPVNKCNISATSLNGKIFFKNIETGKHDYNNSIKSDRIIKLKSTNGNINIE